MSTQIGCRYRMGVSGLLMMLVPWETLAGWPAAPNPSVLHFLLLLVGVPLLLTLIIAGASYAASGRELRRYGPAVNPATFEGAPGVESGSTAVPAGIEAAGAGTGTGGASARW